MNGPADQQSPQLVMLRRSLDGLPPVELPEGYSLRHYREGDQAAWDRIIAETFGPDPGEGRFEREMRTDDAFRPERVLLIFRGEDDPAATASAWARGQYGPDTGYLHMVGARPSHKGRRLGYLVSLAALHHLAAEGFRQAVLQTNDFRIPAVKTYLRLGFEPLLVHENQRKRWREVFATIEGSGAGTSVPAPMNREDSRSGSPAPGEELCARFSEQLEGPIYVPDTNGR